MQNNIVSDFLKNQLNSDIIVDFGGTKELNYYENFAKNNYIIANIEGEVDRKEDLRNLTFESNSIDTAICISVLQHIYEYDAAIDEIIRVLKPGGECLITNGFMFPVCMEQDYFRFTPKFWEKRLENENVDFKIELIGNKYAATSNLFMRPYGYWFGFRLIVDKLLSFPFTFISKLIDKSNDNAPLGVSVTIRKR